MLERQKDKLPALRDVPKEVLEEPAKVDKVSLKYTVLQRLMNYFMQELLLLQIS